MNSKQNYIDPSIQNKPLQNMVSSNSNLRMAKQRDRVDLLNSQQELLKDLEYQSKLDDFRLKQIQLEYERRRKN